MEMNKDMINAMKANAERTQRQTVETYRRLNRYVRKGQILFTGSSLMEQFPISELSMSHELGKIIYNRGVGGFKTSDMLANIDVMLLDPEPKYVFINIGTNDLAIYPDGTPWQEVLQKNYDAILGQLKEKLPETEAYVMAFYPVPREDEESLKVAAMFGSVVRSKATLAEANEIAEGLAKKYGYHFINVNEGLADENGDMKPEFMKDHIHFYPDGYELVYRNLEKYLKKLN